MDLKPLRVLALVFVVGCGATVARGVDDDVPAAADAPAAIDVPAAIDAGRPDAGAPLDAGASADVAMRPDVPFTVVDAGPPAICPLRGSSWDVDVGGMSAAWEFSADGRWVVSTEGEVIASGDYTLMADEVALFNEMSGTGCDPADRGTFRLDFSPDCARLRLVVERDDCSDRGEGIALFRFTRR